MVSDIMLLLLMTSLDLLRSTLYVLNQFYDILVRFHAFFCTQFSRKVKVFQSDGGTEFVNANVRDFMHLHGILHSLSCPYTPQQNGRAESKHRYIVETGLSMLFHAHDSTFLWFDAFATTVYVINRLPSSILHDSSPFQLLFVYVPNYAHFKPFGCRVFPYLQDYAANKLEPRSQPCIFLGYSSIYKGFRCFDPASSRVFTTRHDQFDEHYFPFSHELSSIWLSDLDVTIFLDATGASSSSTSCQPSSPIPSSASLPAAPAHAVAHHSKPILDDLAESSSQNPHPNHIVPTEPSSASLKSRTAPPRHHMITRA